MVLLKNFSTCTIETNYGTILKTIENMEDYEKLCNFDFQMDKNLQQYTKIMEISNKYVVSEFFFYGKTIALWEKNYGTFKNNMILYRKLCNFDIHYEKNIVLWKELWYFIKLQLTVANYNLL